MLGYSYTIENTYTGKSFVVNGNPDGSFPCQTGEGILLQQYPAFDLSVRNASINRSGQHGIFDFFSFYGQRNISFQGVIMATSYADLIARERLIQEVLTLPAQPVAGVNDGYVKISWTDVNGVEWFVNAKIQQDVRFSRDLSIRTRASFFLSMKASSPYILTTTQYEEGVWRGWRQGIALLPMFLANNINIGYFQLMNIYQEGSADSPATYRIIGPATNPKITRFLESFTDSTDISNFDENWSGGEDDIINFQSNAKARKLVSADGEMQRMTLTENLDLTTGEHITFYFYIDDIAQFPLGLEGQTQCQVRFIDTEGVDEFFAEFLRGNDTLRTGWNYFILLKDNFQAIGSPAWSDITKVEFNIRSSETVNSQPIDLLEYIDDTDIQNYWTETGDGDNPEVETEDIFYGEKSGKFPWTAAGGTATFTHTTLPSIQVESLAGVATGNPTSGKLVLYYKTVNTDVTQFSNLEIGTDNANKVSWSNQALVTDGTWQQMILNLTDAAVAGTPDWNDIQRLAFTVDNTISDGEILIGDISLLPTGDISDLEITFDNLKSRTVSFTEKKLELETTLIEGEYVDFDTENGTIRNGDGDDLSLFLTNDSEWFYLSPQQNLLLMESEDRNPLVTFEFPYQLHTNLADATIPLYFPFDEGAGNTSEDISGNELIATLDRVNWKTARTGYGLEFDGSSGKATVPDNLAYRNIWDNGGSISVRFTPNATSANGDTILDKTSAILGTGWRLELNDVAGNYANIRLEVDFNDGGAITTAQWELTGRYIKLGEENHIIIKYDAGAVGNDPSFIVNGVQVSTNESTAPVGVRVDDTGSVLTLGNNLAETQTFDGVLSELIFSNIEVTTTTAKDLFIKPYYQKYRDSFKAFWRSAEL